MTSYDLVIVGGGVGGASLATVMQRAGYRCAVLEKTEAFDDRTRGEWIAPWGVAEAIALGLHDDIVAARGHVLRRHARFGPDIEPETSMATALDLAMVDGVDGPMTQRHPDLCQVLLDAAAHAGVEVVRGVSDVAVTPGAAPLVRYAAASGPETLHGRLVIAADGRSSAIRRSLGITLHRNAPHHLFSGLLVDDVEGWPEDLQAIGTEGDVHYLIFPQGQGRVRLYLGFGLTQPRRVSGPNGPDRFLDSFVLSSLPDPHTFRRATPISPCATFGNEAAWVDDPTAVEGVVLLADAAGWDDPITGQGLSATLRDVRILSGQLHRVETWTPAHLAPYGDERRERMRRLRFASGLTAALVNEFGPDAEARRRSFQQRSAQDRTLGLARMAAMVGPDALPASAFTDAEWDRALGDVPA